MPDTLDLAAKRYAQAAYELALQDGNLREWEGALGQMAEFMGDVEVRRVLENTRVGMDAKQRLIEAALGDLPRLPLNLARLLVRKGRTSLADDIVSQFQELVEQREGIARVKARTAVPLSDAERQSLTERLEQQTGRRVVLETEVDPALLGGVMVQIGDRLVDASTRARLEALRDNLVGAL
jgi:F-type H+-transporting ATPase subunit delta